ncbi:DUF6152 family protein [soil metagenome]
MRFRRTLLAAALAVLPLGVAAHHGWQWATGEEFALAGTIVEARLGNPHGVLTIDAEDGEQWLVEVGQPWRNAEAGLEDGMLVPGVALTAEGHRSVDPEERLMKAERVYIEGRLFDLYPGRS